MHTYRDNKVFDTTLGKIQCSKIKCRSFSDSTVCGVWGERGSFALQAANPNSVPSIPYAPLAYQR